MERAERREKVKFERVPLIEGSGFYVFDVDPRGVNYKNPHYCGDLLYTGAVLLDVVMYRLTNQNYPDARFLRVVTRRREDGRRRTELVSLPRFYPDHPYNYSGAIEERGEFWEYTVTCKDIGRSFFYGVELSDCQKVWAVKGRLGSSPSKERDGSLKVAIHGREKKSPQHGGKEMKWHGVLDLSGENPGALVGDTVEELNRFLGRRSEIPIWKSLTKV